METFDKANVQKFVDLFSYRAQRLDEDEKDFHASLIEFTEFFAKTKDDKDKDGKPIKYDKPYHFRLENHAEFKKFSLIISTAMYAVPKVVINMRKELYQLETGKSSMIPEILQPAPISVNINPNEQKSYKDKLLNKLQKPISDPNSPHLMMQKFINDIQVMPIKWRNIIHWYELGVRKRSLINSNLSLSGLLDNIVIVFNTFIEPNLVWVVHYSNELIKSESEERAVQVLQVYLKVTQQNQNNPQLKQF